MKEFTGEYGGGARAALWKAQGGPRRPGTGSDSEVARGDVVVAVKFQVVERCRDAEPSRHGRGLAAPHARPADDHHIAPAHRAAHQHDLELDRRLRGERARTEKKYPGRADVPRHQGNGKVFRSAVYAP